MNESKYSSSSEGFRVISHYGGERIKVQILDETKAVLQWKAVLPNGKGG
jgi:hypothetical protein